MNEQTVNQTVDQTVNQTPKARKSWKVRLGFLGAGLVVALVLSAVAATQLVPRFSNHGSGFTARLGWYLEHGQFGADVRTLAATVKYVASSDEETAADTSGTSQPVAGTTSASIPKI